MPDVVSPEARSRMMAGIRGKDTKPELIIRKGLHPRGFRYKLHDRKLPGKPDLCFPKYRAVILVNGCFWHGHDCHLFKWPSTRNAFWKEKITSNKERDKKNVCALKKLGWRVLVIWECALKGTTRHDPEYVIKEVEQWLKTGNDHRVIEGKKANNKKANSS
ncbi:very short patch repair endonuclease [Thiolapillus sp.]|uniref:very short patch repair endonuclease n=1 Tax=Thiolapillus sp. TaxID=2017437 RepID=UPI0025CF1F87|nr:very short patch repair endonuclease [Thiolapillus sp.]